MGSRQIVLVSTAGISVRNAGIFWWEAKTKRLFSQCSISGMIVTELSYYWSNKKKLKILIVKHTLL
jgi:hypothetical protein